MSITDPLGVVPPRPEASLRVFLSHASEDLAAVELVRRQVEALGLSVYLAEHDPQPGTSIAMKVERALLQCDAVIVLLTTAGVNSAYVQQEVGLARAHKKPIVPIVEKGVDITRLGLLGETEWLELDLSQPADALARITASLRPLVLAQVSVDVTVTTPPAELDLSTALLLIGLGLILGLVVSSIVNGDGRA